MILSTYKPFTKTRYSKYFHIVVHDFDTSLFMKRELYFLYKSIFLFNNLTLPVPSEKYTIT